MNAFQILSEFLTNNENLSPVFGWSFGRNHFCMQHITHEIHASNILFVFFFDVFMGDSF